MALAERADLVARLSLDDQFTKKIGGASKALSTFGTGAKTAASNIVKLGAAAAVGLAGATILAVKSGVQSLSELSTAQQQTAAVIASTGGIAGITAARVREMAEALENVTTVDDKVIQTGENMLLTFTNIGADVFPQATKAMVDMAIAMNGGSVEGLDLKATAIQLGKALQDPVKGVTALRKVGVALTDQQTDQIKSLVKLGKVEQAQGIILQELEVEFGNAGKAAGQDFGSDMRRLQDAQEDLTMALAKGLMPVLTRAAKWLNEKLADPKVTAAISKLGDELAAAGSALLGFLGSVDWGAVANGMGAAKDAAVGIAGAFLGLPDWVKAAVLTGWGLNALSGGALGNIVGSLASGIIKGVLGINAGVVNINAGVANGGGGGVAGGAGGIAKAAGAVVPLVALGTTLGLAVGAVQAKVTNDTKDAASNVQARGTAALAKNLSFAELTTRIAAVDQGIAEINGNALFQIVGGKDAVAKLESIRAELVIASRSDRVLAENRAAADQSATEAALRANLAMPALTADAVESALRANLQPPVVNVTVTTNVTARAVVDSTEQLYRVGGGGRVLHD